ncbi:LOW QUALITY PROTEIN: protein TPR1-like [Dioscorea cayenensis subsp. rotundata]|uniref:LOW QUALITY PROTEIN: protein TPR1-like n=1 Tax=Dioscorea cayennensis subsp. rotundata TaxID=55577 RepID=A0AB40C8L0_DIOCR|nr:LOW QUALITY PROTEIN: protein TPR1-like [Dioscorea cayenensis subsp. rotundata]
MSSLSRELVFLILQFLEEEKFKESVHKLEQESGFFFNIKYFDEKVQAGEWDEVEKYLSGFTKVDDNRYSMKIFFEIRKQKYLEALDRHDRAKAVEILVKDLKVFSTFNEELFKEITQLLTLENFRENEQLSKYGDTKSARSIMLIELKKLIEANPLFREKLVFPTLKASRLRTLINQSLNWQHQLCKNPRQNPDIKTLFTDHTCAPPNGARAPSVSVPLAAVPKPATYTPLGPHAPFPPAAAANASALAGWMANAAGSSSVQSAVVAAPTISIPPNQVSILKHPRTPNTLTMTDYQNADSEQLMKRMRSSTHQADEVTYPAPIPQIAWSLDDLPRTVACAMNQGSNVTSMDFHPSHHTLLLVGTGTGEITLWEIGLRERLVSKPFKLRDIASCSSQFQAAMVKDTSISVTKVSWSPDGNLIGVAFSKHLIHLHAYQAPNELHQHIEIEAHMGGVNDIAFAHPNKQVSVVTCGEDKLIKVWDLTGQKLYTFEGHEAPIYSICPHHKENIQFVFSTAIDGKIKAWLYDNIGSRVDYDAPGRSCTTMLYSSDGSRLFSCGTSKEGDSFLVEWNESEGAIKRTYVGFRKKSAGVVQFDTTQNHFLAAGEENQIKFWDVDIVNMITSTDADGGLQSLPRLRFNKEGNLLAVTTVDNGFKILANAEGHRSLRAFGSRSFEAFRAQYESSPVKVSVAPVVASISPSISRVDRLDRSSPAKPSPILNGGSPSSRGMEIKPRILEDLSDKAKQWELSEILDPLHCRVVPMPEGTEPASKVARLLYTNSGGGLLALGSNAIQRLWKWSRNEQNPSGKATASIAPQHWQPNSGLLMINDVSETNLEEAVPCIALSKNDSYVMSACGGKVSLFNMMTFKIMTTFMPPPPTSTYLAFHLLDNNIIAIGMEDATIHIYNVRVDEVKTKLSGHQKRITGLAFSNSLGILVSSGADAQLCIWNTDNWEKKKSIAIQLPAGKPPAGDTRVQFHSDQIRLLVSHETQIAIYDTSKAERIRQWVPQGTLSAPISHAAYSCNSQLVYAAFCDANIGVFDADNLRLRCRIAPSAYLSSPAANSNPPVYPLVIATHPQEPNQFAIGLTDGSVKVIEPIESEGRWGNSSPVDNGVSNGRATASSATSNSAADQLQR